MVVNNVVDNIRPFSIWTRAYEEKLDERSGFELGQVVERARLPGGIEKWNGGGVKYGQGSNQSLVRKMLKEYGDFPGFSSMKLESFDEVFDHVDTIYSLMYAHYVLGKNSGNRFPYKECCPSAQNLMVASVVGGYPNASVLYDDFDDHCYVGFPFLLNDEKGLIIADPTSDQLWKRKVSPRNSIFVVKDGDWGYKSDWPCRKNLNKKDCGKFPKGAELYPDCFVNLDSFQRRKGSWCNYNYDIDDFFEKVFENSFEFGRK